MYVIQSASNGKYRNVNLVPTAKGQIMWVDDPLNAKIYYQQPRWMQSYFETGLFRWVGLLEARADYLVAQTRVIAGGQHKVGTHRVRGKA